MSARRMGRTGILLLRRYAGQGLEPVAEVRHAQALSPLHHRISDNVSRFLVQLDVRVLSGFHDLVVARGEEAVPDRTQIWAHSSAACRR